MHIRYLFLTVNQLWNKIVDQTEIATRALGEMKASKNMLL